MTQQAKSHGTATSDGARIGSFIDGNYGFGAMGISLSPWYDYAIVPISRYNFFSGAAAEAGFLPIARPLFPNVTFQGYTNVVALDTCRGLRVTMTNTTHGAVTLVISGWDIWNQKLTQTLSIPDGLPVFSTKSFSHINSVYISGQCSGIDIGVANTFGLPFFCPNGSYLTAMFAGHPDYSITLDTEEPDQITYLDYVPFDPADGIGFLAGDTSTPSATSGDPRGLFGVSSPVSGGEGVRLIQYCPGFDPMAGTILNQSAQQPTQSNTYGLTQYSGGWQ